MAMQTLETPTTHLAQLAAALFGEEWAAAVSRFTGVSLRNCQRAKAAAEAGEDERRAVGILDALVRRLDSLAPQIQEAFNEVKPGPNPFRAAPLPKHAGVAITMDEATRQRLYDLLHRAATYRDDTIDESLLQALAYDLRLAGNAGLQPAAEVVSIRALWPLLLFQMKLLRTTSGYINTGPGEVAIMDDLEEAVFTALASAYPNPDDSENVKAAWFELGLDPLDPLFDERATARAAWFLDAKTSRRRGTLMNLLESMSDLYAAMDGEVDDGRPSMAELEQWIDKWPDKDF